MKKKDTYEATIYVQIELKSSILPIKQIQQQGKGRSLIRGYLKFIIIFTF